MNFFLVVIVLFLCIVGVCSSFEFECSTGGCVNVTSKCDGIVDCLDGSDEFVCRKLYMHAHVRIHSFESTVHL